MTSTTLSDDIRRYHVVLVNTLSEIKEALPTNAQGFVLFLAVDASAIGAHNDTRGVPRPLATRVRILVRLGSGL